MKTLARTLAVAVALVIATTAAAAATPPTTTDDPHSQLAQRKALYQSELDTTLARHRALGALAAPPAATTHLAAPGTSVGMLATLLVGLVGGLIGGSLVVVGVVVTRAGRLRVRDAA
jgi:predicted lipid-binding transport protein (Tim44 family)